MKICFVTTMDASAWGGSEELWFLTAQNLMNIGYDIAAFIPRSRGDAPKLGLLKKEGASIFYYGLKYSWMNHMVAKIRRLLKLEIHPWPVCRVWKNADLVVVSQGACLDGASWLRLLRKHEKRYVILCQANCESLWPNDVTSAEMRTLFKTAMASYFVSEENLRLFKLQTGFDGANAKIVWNPLQSNTPRSPLAWPVDDGIFKLAVVGRIEPYAKGQDLIIEAMSQSQWRDRPIMVTIYGIGAWIETAKYVIKQRGIKNITFGGYASPAEIWQNHHLLLLPSRHEGMALVMLEAMWVGRPVLATAVAGAVSEIVDGVNGFLCAAPTVALWSEAMEHAWQMRDKWNEMGNAAAVMIRERIGSVSPEEQFAMELRKIISD